MVDASVWWMVDAIQSIRLQAMRRVTESKMQNDRRSHRSFAGFMAKYQDTMTVTCMHTHYAYYVAMNIASSTVVSVSLLLECYCHVLLVLWTANEYIDEHFSSFH